MTSVVIDGTISRDDPDHGTVRFERRLPVSVERVWASITGPAQLARWLAPSEVDLRIGGRIVHRFDPQDEDQRVEGTILVLDPPRTLEYQWLFPGETESVLRYDLVVDGSSTLLTLTHRRLGGQNVAGYGAGWHAYLDALEALAMGGPAPEWDATYGVVLPAYRVRWSEQ